MSFITWPRSGRLRRGTHDEQPIGVVGLGGPRLRHIRKILAQEFTACISILRRTRLIFWSITNLVRFFQIRMWACPSWVLHQNPVICYHFPHSYGHWGNKISGNQTNNQNFSGKPSSIFFESIWTSTKNMVLLVTSRFLMAIIGGKQTRLITIS